MSNRRNAPEHRYGGTAPRFLNLVSKVRFLPGARCTARPSGGAFFLPSSDGTTFFSPVNVSLADHRLTWRIGIALAAGFLGALVWLHGRHQSPNHLPAIPIDGVGST